jgi:hypothetical protein
VQDEQEQREKVEAFVRSLYETRDLLDLEGYVGHWADTAVTEDIVLAANGPCAVPQPRATIREGSVRTFAALKTPGRFHKFVYAVGDLRYGIAGEAVCPANSFFQSPIDLMNIFNLESGLVASKPDYWDTGQVTSTEIYTGGPTVTAGVMRPLAPVHPGDEPRKATCTNEYPVDTRHASPEMHAFVAKFTAALTSGNAGRVSKFFTEDALYINPVLHLHQGEAGYDAYNRSIQIRGQRTIARMFESVLPLLPDAKGSMVLHVVGGKPGGGYEWKSGGIYSKQGLTRSGIRGATSITLWGDRITRMSVKFDTIQMTKDQREALRKRLATACFTS